MPKELKALSEEERQRELQEQSAYDADRHQEFLEEKRAERRAKVQRLLAGKRFIFNPLNVASLNATIKKVARKNNLLNAVPTEKFPSADAFVRKVLEIFMEHGVPQEDLDSIASCFELMKEEGVNGKSKSRENE